MTVTSTGPGSPGEGFSPLEVRVTDIQAVPGRPSVGEVTITNRGDAAAVVTLEVVGLDPGWVETDPTGPALEPGQSRAFWLRVTPPAGHPPCRLVGQVVAVDGQGRRATADLNVGIADGSVVSIALDPPEVRGGSRGRTLVVLRNRGRTPLRAELTGSSPDPNLRVALASTTQVLPPGAEVRVKARVSAPRPVSGPARRPFIVSASTGGTPVSVEASFTQRPVFSPYLTKAVAVVLVVAVWVAAAVVGISALNKHLSKTATNKANQNSPASVAPSPNAGGGSGGGGGAGGSGGSGGGAGGPSAAGGAAAAAAPFGGQLAGKVTAANPGGITVTVTPSSLSAIGGSAGSGSSSAATTAASSSSSGGGAVLTSASLGSKSAGAYELAAASTAPGKLFGEALPASAALPRTSGGATSLGTTTAPDGTWVLEGITTPGYYQVTFSKAGYATASYVVDVPLNGKPVTLAARMVPGNGSLSGSVVGPNGPLGGVLLSITDGTVNLTTRTPTVGGNTGSWAVQGLTTPGTYLITATLPGYGTATDLVTLGAGASSSGNNINMTPGVGSLSGLVEAATTSTPAGGVTVTASNAAVTRTTTTTTDGPVGTYSLPDLPVPGTYALTFSGPGWISQTQQVTLSADPSATNATVNARVTPSGADVSGTASDTSGQGLAGAGVILSNADNTYKTLTTSAAPVGSFDFGQVAPGQYVLSVEDFGYTTQSAQVTVGAGQAQTVNLSLPYVGATNINTATITGSVESLSTAKAVSGAQISLDGKPTGFTTSSIGTYQITNVSPGVHEITATCPVSSPCQSVDPATGQPVSSAYETTSVNVTVPLGNAAFAPVVLMPTLDRLAGVVMTVTGTAVPNPVVTLTNPSNGTTYTASTTPVASGTTAALGGFEFDNLPHGNYTLQISGPNNTSACGTGTSLYQPTTLSVTMPTGADVLLTGTTAPHLTVNPLYQVKAYIVAPGSGGPALTSGVSITATDQNPAHPFSLSCQSTADVTQIPLPTNLIGDQFVANFTYTDASGVKYTAAPSNPFTDQTNNGIVDTAVLVPPTAPITITLEYPYRSHSPAIDCTVTTAVVAGCPTVTADDLPTVTVTGAIVGSGGAVDSTTPLPASTDGSGVWTFTPPSPGGLEQGPVTVTVSGGAFATSSYTATTTVASTGGGTPPTTVSYVLNPKPTAVTGTVTPFAGTAVSVSPALTGLSVTTDSTGNLVWDDAASTAGQALPGVYALTFSHSGYDSFTEPSLSIGLCATSCTSAIGAVNLVPHAELDVSPSFTPAPGLAYPTVTVTNNSNALIGSVTLSAGNLTAKFPDLSVTGNPYKIQIVAPGFITPPAQNATLSAPSTNVPITLTPEAYFTGTVDGSINNNTPTPLANVPVTATLVSANGCTQGIESPVTVTTDISGNYTLAPDPATGDGGFCPGSSWTVSAVDSSGNPPAGYGTGPTIPLTASAGNNSVNAANSGNPIILPANLVQETFTVEDYSGTPLSGVALLGSSPIGHTVPVPVSGVTPTTDANGQIVVYVDPTNYQFSFTKFQYAQLSESIIFGIGEGPQTATVKMALNQNTITGTVSTPNAASEGACSGNASCGLNNVSIALVDGSGNTVATTSTNSSGAYTLTKILDGGYTLEATLNNYVYATGSAPSFATNSAGKITQNVSLIPTSQNVSVTVTSNLGTDQSSNSVNLVPATPPSGTSLTCKDGGTLTGLGQGVTEVGTIASGKAVIPNVVPDFYSLSVTGTNVPTQTAGGLLVCPGGNVSNYAPGSSTATDKAAFEVLEGEITGGVAVIAGDGITASNVNITVSPGGQQYSVSCSDTPCDTGTYTTGMVALGTSYTITASGGANYASPTATADLTTGKPSGPTNVGNVAVYPIPRSVSLQVDNGPNGDTSGAVPGATVTLTDSNLGSSYTETGTTASDGSVTIANVMPDESANYSITVKSGSTTLAVSGVTSLQVPVGSGTFAGGTVYAQYYGSVTAALSGNSSAGVTVNVCSDSACSNVVATSGVTTASSYVAYVPPGPYFVQAVPSGGGAVTPAGAQSTTVPVAGNKNVSFSYAPVKPGAPIIGTATAGTGQATVTFTAPSSDGGATITGYTVNASPGHASASCTSSPCTVTGLTNGNTYTFTVTATNSAGTGPSSAASNSVTPELASQTITFPDPVTQTISVSPTVTVSATASSGLAVTFTSATNSVCTVAGSTVTLKAAGTCTIDANQAGDGTNWAAAPQVADSFTVNS